jgi:hypothetical protein
MERAYLALARILQSGHRSDAPAYAWQRVGRLDRPLKLAIAGGMRMQGRRLERPVRPAERRQVSTRPARDVPVPVHSTCVDRQTDKVKGRGPPKLDLTTNLCAPGPSTGIARRRLGA